MMFLPALWSRPRRCGREGGTDGCGLGKEKGRERKRKIHPNATGSSISPTADCPPRNRIRRVLLVQQVEVPPAETPDVLRGQVALAHERPGDLEERERCKKKTVIDGFCTRLL